MFCVKIFWLVWDYESVQESPQQYVAKSLRLTQEMRENDDGFRRIVRTSQQYLDISMP